MAQSAKTQRARRGRPQEADPREISRIALDLFEREGFDRVTMDEIAEAASVSRRTLFRLFPSKWDLVWGSLGDILDVMRQRAAALSGADLRVGGVLREFIEPFLRPLDDPEAAATARRRLRVIASAPALLDHPTLREIEAGDFAPVVTRAFPVARLGEAFTLMSRYQHIGKLVFTFERGGSGA